MARKQGIITDEDLQIAREKAIQASKSRQVEERIIPIRRGLSICVPVNATTEEIERRKERFMQKNGLIKAVAG
ncbi:hypothetical protein [Dysgonomonas massiliensis]|uniref:hypothetical protein n=1 Tax=Dysgonomonas massiliensis TaxID=2040292 RepID=UPI000C75D829|nr:hypothetical protein [Dysgonomonas massiliensis]